jgi:hypothetical protein
MLSNQDQMKVLAEVERRMDNGTMTFVRDSSGKRWPFSIEVLQTSGCISGQTVNETILTHLMEANLAHIQMQIALSKAKK